MLEEKPNGKANGGVRVNGKRLNGHGGKSAADNMIDAKPGIFAEPTAKPDREASASA
jgi:hypothetical protein